VLPFYHITLGRRTAAPTLMSLTGVLPGCSSVASMLLFLFIPPHSSSVLSVVPDVSVSPQLLHQSTLIRCVPY